MYIAAEHSIKQARRNGGRRSRNDNESNAENAMGREPWFAAHRLVFLHFPGPSERKRLIAQAKYVSLIVMKHKEILRQRERLTRQLPSAAEIVRGSLLERTIRHRRGCPKCARGEGHTVWVLTVGYAGGKTRQISLHGDQREQVERWLKNYQELKAKLEEICELNQRLLRPEE